MLSRSLLLFSTAVVFAVSGPVSNAEPIGVEIDLTTQLFLGDESAFDRGKFINVHSDYWGDEAFTPEDVELLVEHFGVGFGRFFNSPFNYYKGGPPYLSTEQLEALRDDHRHSKTSNANAAFETRKRIVTEHPRVAFRMGASHEEAARFAADYFEMMYTDENRPMFYEPMNEPFVHAGDFGEDQDNIRREMSKYFAAIGKEFDRRGIDTKILGYSSAWPSMELWDFRHWRSRMQMFMDVAGEHVDGISLHPYDGTNVTGQDNRRSGSNVEAIMDLVETYGYIKWGEPKPLAITEFGDIPKGFGPEYSPAGASAHLNSLNHLTFGLIDRQDRLLIAIPFITTKSPWYYKNPENNFEPYGVDLWRPDKSTIVDGRVTSFLRTEKFFFYDYWKDVKGDRAVVGTSDPDLLAHVFVDGRQVYVCLNNLETEARTVQINHAADLPAGTTTHVRRLHVPQGKPAVYENEDHDSVVTELTFAPHEAVLLRYDLPQTITRTTKAVSRQHYSRDFQQPIASGQTLSFGFTDVATGEGRAALRMSLGRKHDVTKQPEVRVNGVAVAVPNDWAGYDQANREDFFGAVTMPVPVEALKPNTTVEITFPDSGGRVSSVILVTEIESPM
ncbi:MAG: T9SS C-terminal target domain-containing protein [Planctomycetota bacterium]